MDAPETGYGWADGCPDLDAFCVSVAVGSDPAAVVVAFAADPTTAPPGSHTPGRTPRFTEA